MYRKLEEFNLTDFKLSSNSKGNSDTNMAQFSLLVVLKCSFKRGMSSFAQIFEIQLYSDSKRKGMGMTVTNEIPPLNIVM